MKVITYLTMPIVPNSDNEGDQAYHAQQVKGRTLPEDFVLFCAGIRRGFEGERRRGWREDGGAERPELTWLTWGRPSRPSSPAQRSLTS